MVSVGVTFCQKRDYISIDVIDSPGNPNNHLREAWQIFYKKIEKIKVSGIMKGANENGYNYCWFTEEI